MFFKRWAARMRASNGHLAVFWTVLGLASGVLLWNGFIVSLDATSTTEFCISCHSMETYIYQDYKQSIHYRNTLGIQAGCADCHIPKPLVAKLVRKTIGLQDVYHTLLGTIDTPEKFSARKQLLTERVQARMRASDSRECRSCHHLEQMDFARQSAAAGKLHQEAKQLQTTCIDCHQGVGHPHASVASDTRLEESFSLE
ncbi:MAG: NapC/NirT family cytochrome c [Gammaproteobacteria bacterium]